MVRCLLRYLLLLFLLTISPKLFAQFPYQESFKNSTAPKIVFGGAPSAFLTAFGSSILGGTPIDTSGNGALRLTNATNNQKGFAYSVSDFPSSNGLKVEFEYSIYGGTGADGISFFLFDARADPFVIGGFGGSLGYAQITTTNPASTGVSNGYLAIGLDEFGNFSNPNEGRQGGTTQVPGSITLRGRGDGSDLRPENYRFLITQKTDAFGVSLVGDETKRVTNPALSGYRKVNIELIPNVKGGYNVNVKITKGGIPQTTAKIINNYYYPDVAPDNLRYGFASSTGDQTNFHEIRNLTIDIYNPQPKAVADVLNACIGNYATINVTANDLGTTENVSINKKSIDLNPSVPGIQTSFNVANSGLFTVDSNALVKFVPASGFSGMASAQYTFENSLGFPSNAASITLTYSAPPTVPSAGADQILTNNSVTTSTALRASVSANETGAWTQVSGPNAAVFSNATISNTNVLNLVGGTYVFRWTVTSAGGCSLSDDVQITITQPPVANDDAARTRFNTAVTVPILNNDTYSGTAVLDKSKIEIKSAPLHGTLSITSSGQIIYTPSTDFQGIDSLKYTIADTNGLVSNIATAVITIFGPPSIAPDIVTGASSGKPVSIPILIPAGGSINIVKQPEHGSTTIDPLTGLPIYTPDPKYSGQDAFTYTIIDADGNPSKSPGTVTIFVQLPAKIGLAKSLVLNSKNTDGSYKLTYLFTVVNTGGVAIRNISLIDDLNLSFPGCVFTVNRLNASGNLVANTNYNGTTVKDMLLNTSTMDPETKETLTLELNVVLTDKDGIFNNSATIEGTSVNDSSKTSDVSTDGVNPDPLITGDVSPNDPTPATLIKNPLFIPKGFSPNNDGINDAFVIENANGRQLLVEVYNRWGNRIYRSTDYKNNWNGKTTEGIHIGDQVPMGTYYYVVVVDNKEKYVGYITINK